MSDLKKARRGLSLALFTVALVKGLFLLVGFTGERVLKWFLHLVYADASSAAFEEFADTTTLSSALFDIVITIFCSFIPLAIYFWLSGNRFRDVIPTEKASLLQIGYGVGATVTVGYLANIGGYYLLLWLFRLLGEENTFYRMTQGSSSYPTNFWVLILLLLSVAVLPALLEEFLVRGILLSATRKFGLCFSLFCSGFFFAFLHNTWLQIPFTFVLGILLAYFTLRFNTIWIAVISHFIFNLNSVILSLISQNSQAYGFIWSSLWFFLFFPLMVGLTVAGIVIYGIKKPNEVKCNFSWGQKTLTLLASPFFWIFIAFTVIRLASLLFR